MKEQIFSLKKSNKELAGFLKKVRNLDQSDLQRSKAKEALALLRSRKNDFIGTDYEKDYWNGISFELFHIAQGDALLENNQSAISKLEDSLKAAEKGPYRDWKFYVKGTLLYFKNDLNGLRQCIEKIDLNKEVLERLEKGLKERGTIDYLKDYFCIE